MGSSHSKPKGASKSPPKTDTTPSSVATPSPSEAAPESTSSEPLGQPPTRPEGADSNPRTSADARDSDVPPRPPSSQTSSGDRPPSTPANGKETDHMSTRPRSVETPGVKEVAVIQVNNPENYEDDTNQTGLSHYEMKIMDKFYAAPDRPRSKAYTEAAAADRQRRVHRAERKAEKQARRKSKSKGEAQAPDPEPNTVGWAIQNTKRLGILNLSKMDLADVPDEVFESMPGTARIINISFNRISQLDVRLCDYVLVQRLSANGNLLTSIPTTICRMTALKKLDLAGNKLTALPDAFAGMKLLEHVDLSDNELTQLPPSLTTLNLTALNLSRNKFATAPVEISSMEWLMDLDMSFNQIAEVPIEYVGLRQLIAMNLEQNVIRDFPNEILEACTELVTLRLRGNPITMAVLETKACYSQFDNRRNIKFKRQLDAGTISEADLLPADS